MVADNFAIPSAMDAMLNVARSYEGLSDDLARRLRQQPDEKGDVG